MHKNTYNYIIMQDSETQIILQLIANNVTQIRKSKNMTQDELAEKARIDRTYVGYIENAKHNVSIGKLVLLAKALDVDVAEFFEF